MAIIKGNLVNTPERKTAKSGKDFYSFSLAESFGRDENKKTTFYDVTAFIDDLDADILAKGQYVEVVGRIEATSYPKKDGSTGVSVKLITSAIKPIERKAPAPAAE